MKPLLNALAHWRPTKVLVVGDFMLDQLVYGFADRLTGDAPVPILAAQRTEEIPGGAANVCVDLVALHCKVKAFGVLGDDREAVLLKDKLHNLGIDTQGLISDPTRPTTVKRNLIGLAQHRHPQKMFRVDFESREPLEPALRNHLLQQLDAAIKWADVIALEDYNKGVCSPEFCAELIRRAKAKGVEVLVDPAGIEDYSRYQGCTAITPNRTEAQRATRLNAYEGDDPAMGAAHNTALATSLAQTTQAHAIILTLDRHGALLLEAGADPVAVPTVARQVYDVTGAGDMVLAALAAARGNNLPWIDAVRFANAAAGLEVEIFGVAAIPFERVYQSLLVQGNRLVGKRRTIDEAKIELAAARREGKSIVFTNGCFDVLHAGHIRLLRAARSKGDFLVLAINSDDSIKRLKGQDRPVHSEADRVEVLSELASVDIVVVYEDDTPVQTLNALKPDVLVKGGDYTREQVVGHELVESWGGRVELVDLLEGRSSTAAIEKMRATTSEGGA